jgi:hypothetical protein
MQTALLFYFLNFLTLAPTNQVDFSIIEQAVVYKDGFASLQVEFSNVSNSTIVLYDVCPLITMGWTPDDVEPPYSGSSGFFIQLSSPNNQKIDYSITSDFGTLSSEYKKNTKDCYNKKSLTDYAIIILKPSETRKFHMKVWFRKYDFKAGEYELNLAYCQNSSRFIKHKLTKNRSDLVTFSGCLFSNKIKLIKPLD